MSDHPVIVLSWTCVLIRPKVVQVCRPYIPRPRIKVSHRFFINSIPRLLLISHIISTPFSRHTMAEADWKAFVDFVDKEDNIKHFIDRLRAAVEIQRSVSMPKLLSMRTDLMFESVSGDNTRDGRAKVFDMAEFLNDQLTSFGVETLLVDLGKQKVDEDQLQLPPAIIGRIGTDPNKKTILIYGHYDVQPVSNFRLYDPY